MYSELAKKRRKKVKYDRNETVFATFSQQKNTLFGYKQNIIRDTKLRYCPKKVCKLQSSYICVMNKKSTKNNEAYKRTKIGINF